MTSEPPPGLIFDVQKLWWLAIGLIIVSSSYDRGTEELKSPVKDVDELWDRGWEKGGT